MTDLQQEKAIKMADARRQVRNFSSVGRKGRDGKEVQLVSAIRFLLSWTSSVQSMLGRVFVEMTST
jgi:hypothetical protein